jgi:hypothetical protein
MESRKKCLLEEQDNAIQKKRVVELLRKTKNSETQNGEN